MGCSLESVLSLCDTSFVYDHPSPNFKMLSRKTKRSCNLKFSEFLFLISIYLLIKNRENPRLCLNSCGELAALHVSESICIENALNYTFLESFMTGQTILPYFQINRSMSQFLTHMEPSRSIAAILEMPQCVAYQKKKCC